MKTQKDYFQFLGLKIPIQPRRVVPPQPELRKHQRYAYTAEASEMILWLESSPPTDTRYKTSIVNSSIEGYCLVLRNTQTTVLRVDDIVLLQALSDTPTLYERGCIRWLKQITATDLGIGIHLIS